MISKVIGNGCMCLTISAHALCQALLKTAMLAAVATGPVDLTVILPRAGIGHGGQLAAPEKPLRDRQSPIETGFLKRMYQYLSSNMFYGMLVNLQT